MKHDPSRPSSACLFCRLAGRDPAAQIVFEDASSLAFLDHRPLFPGHTLLVPRDHYETLADLPADEVGPFFANAQLLARAIEDALAAQGTFIAINNRVSQSVPHLHVHLVPRKKGDGLKGFFWPRQRYRGDEHIASVADAIRKSVAVLSS